jgi:hypothetical protein
MGYVFLRFYGIERRLLLGNPPVQEEHALLHEIGRLLDIYGNHASFRGYAEALADHIALRGIGMGQPWRFDGIKRIPDRMNIAFHAAVEKLRGRPAPLDILVRIAPHLVQEQHPQLARRVEAILGKADTRFLIVPEAKVDARRHIPKPYKPSMMGLAEVFPPNIQPRDALDRDWSMLRALVMGALVSLPQVPRPSVPNTPIIPPRPTRVPSVRSTPLPAGSLEWLRALGPISERRLSEIVRMMLGASSERPSLAQIKRTAETLRRLGYGLEPDPLFNPTSAPPEGSVGLIFRRYVPCAMEKPPQDWLLICTILRLAEPDLTRADKLSRALNWPPHAVERLGVIASRKHGACHLPIKSLWKAALKENAVNFAERVSAGLAFLEVADQPHSIQMMESVCPHAPSLLHAAQGLKTKKDILRVLQGHDMELMHVETPKTQVPIVQELKLDEERLRRISEETERATQILADIFVEEQVIPTSPTTLEERKHGFPDRFIGLKEFLTIHAGQNVDIQLWRQECKKYGLGASGTMDALNEWATNLGAEPILEENDNNMIFIQPLPNKC